MTSPIQLGSRPEPWGDERAKTVTFIVTENCQLRCRYCYMDGKNSAGNMTADIARRAADYILEDRGLFNEPSVIWEFIGGEPLLRIDLIDEISDYLKRRMYELDDPWFDSYRFSLSTNGLLYCDPRVQRYITKNKEHLSIGITIDGTKTKHDLQRVYSSGRGSYDDVIKSIPLWLTQFPQASTKATIAHDDLPFLKESVLHLWSLGISNVDINLVFENVWEPGDDELFEEQLRGLADHIIEHNLYQDRNFSFFSRTVGLRLDRSRDNQNWCGAGVMLAVDARGLFYPCVRFAQYSLKRKPPRVVGSCFEGINTNRLRPFLALNRTCQSPAECIDCAVGSGCAWCQGENYDSAPIETINHRATFLCRMHKARARANRYFWGQLDGRLAPFESEQPSHL